MSDDQQPARRVRQYYTRNTPRFLSYGAQRRTRTIHRPLWLPGITQAEAALQAAHRMVEAAARTVDAQRILDMGCGAGAAVIDLALALPGVQVRGVTVSPLQARLAHQSMRAAEPDGRVSFLCADFLHLPWRAAAFDLAYAIEAFAHAADAGQFFAAAASSLRPGGQLILIDDTLAREASRAAWPVRVFTHGWRLYSLLTVEAIAGAAARHGLHLAEQRDLTPHLRGTSLPGWLTWLLSPLSRGRDAWWAGVIGGQALRLCQRRGLVRYTWLRFEKREPALDAAG